MANSAASTDGESHLCVRKLGGEEVLACTAHPGMTVLAVKQLVAEKAGIAVHTQSLIHDMAILDDDICLDVVAGPREKGSISSRLACLSGGLRRAQGGASEAGRPEGG